MTDRISNYPFTPLNDGDWTKDRGNSVWYPTPDVKPKKFNNSEDPVNAKTWSEITKDANDVRNKRISENKKCTRFPKKYKMKTEIGMEVFHLMRENLIFHFFQEERSKSLHSQKKDIKISKEHESRIANKEHLLFLKLK